MIMHSDYADWSTIKSACYMKAKTSNWSLHSHNKWYLVSLTRNKNDNFCPDKWLLCNNNNTKSIHTQPIEQLLEMTHDELLEMIWQMRDYVPELVYSCIWNRQQFTDIDLQLWQIWTQLWLEKMSRSPSMNVHKQSFQGHQKWYEQ